MNRNELDLCGKILNGPSEVLSEMIRFHVYALGTNWKPGRDKGRGTIAFREVKVCRKNGQIQFKYISPTDSFQIMDESVFPKAYSLMYKNCPADLSSSRRYYFGDIRIGVKDKKLYWDKNSFFKSVSSPSVPNSILPEIVSEFQKAFWNDQDAFWKFIEQEHARILENPIRESFEIPESGDLSKIYTGLFIHFNMNDLIDMEHWYSLDGILSALDSHELEVIKDDLFEYHQNVDRYSFKKKLFHTVGSGDKKNDNQFVGFDASQRYKTLSLPRSQLRYIFYHSKIIRACNVSIPWSRPYFFRLIPVGSFNALQAMDYFHRLRSMDFLDSSDDLTPAEEGIKVEPFDYDPVSLLADISDNGGCSKNITSFDLILVRNEKVDTNLGEINSLDRSALRKITKEILARVAAIRLERKMSEKQKLSVAGSFYDLHKNIGKNEKHQVKFVRMMLKLYRGVYYGDPDLERIFLERAFYDIRNEGNLKAFRNHETSYLLLKTLSKEKNMTISQKDLDGIEKSRELGRLLARICWPLDFVINSFLKSQVGQMTLRISGVYPIKSVVKLAEEYTAKVVTHTGERAGNTVVKLDGVSVNKWEELINEFVTDNANFEKSFFLMGFLSEYNKQVYFASKKAE